MHKICFVFKFRFEIIQVSQRLHGTVTAYHEVRMLIVKKCRLRFPANFNDFFGVQFFV